MSRRTIVNDSALPDWLLETVKDIDHPAVAQREDGTNVGVMFKPLVEAIVKLEEQSAHHTRQLESMFVEPAAKPKPDPEFESLVQKPPISLPPVPAPPAGVSDAVVIQMLKTIEAIATKGGK